MIGKTWLTYAEAVGQPAFDLATYWGDRRRWPALDRYVAAELHELATMAALVDWLTRWIPIHIHAALLGGARVPDVAAALGVPPGQVRTVWAPWADGQVHLWHSSDSHEVGVPPSTPTGSAPCSTTSTRGRGDRR